MERRIFPIRPNHIVPKGQTVDRLRIQDRGIERVERIALNHNAAVFPTMKISLLLLQFGNFGIYGYHGIGELVQAGQGIDEAVVPNQDLAASTGLKPSVTVAAQQDGRTRSMVKGIVFHQRMRIGL